MERPESRKESTPAHYGWWWIVRTALVDWYSEDSLHLAAAISYYTLFSLAPLLLLMTAAIGAVWGEQAVTGEIHEQVESFLGREGAILLEDLIARARVSRSSLLATTLGILILLWGASGVFSELKSALNTIWEVPTAPNRGWLDVIRSRAWVFGMLLCIGFLLLVSLLLEAGLAAMQSWAGDRLWVGYSLMQWGNSIGSLMIVTVLFAMIFRFLPDTRAAWKPICVGAFVTAILFHLGKWLFGLYLGQGTIGSAYGPAGAVVVILLWSYYSSLILLLGAEFTQAYARACAPHCSTADALQSPEVGNGTSTNR